MADIKGKKLFDVAHPGKTAADAASKPVVVGNRPILRDPMMSEPKTEPTQEVTDKDVSPQSTFEAQSDGKSNIRPSENFVFEQKHNEEQKSKDARQPEVSTQDSLDDEKNNTPAQKLPSRQPPDDQVAKLIEDKTYFVHVSTAKSKKWLIGLIVLIGLIAFGLAGFLLSS